MLHRLLTFACVSSLVLSGVGVASAVPYYLTGLAPAGSDTIAWAYAVADVGGSPEAVGWSGTSFANRQPVVWSSNGTPTSLLSLLPGASAGSGNVANAIDGDGDIAGVALIGTGQTAFYLPNSGTATYLPTLGGTGNSSAAGVNDSGMVVGSSPATDGNSHAFVWSASTGMVDLGASGNSSSATAISADGNTIVGTLGGNPQPVKWTRSGSTWTMTVLAQLSQYNQAWAYGVNSSGDVVGGAFDYPQGGVPNPEQLALEFLPNGSIVRLGGRARPMPAASTIAA